MDNLVCPVCDDELGIDEEWLITDESMIGQPAGTTEELQGAYAHADCLE